LSPIPSASVATSDGVRNRISSTSMRGRLMRSAGFWARTPSSTAARSVFDKIPTVVFTDDGLSPSADISAIQVRSIPRSMSAMGTSPNAGLILASYRARSRSRVERRRFTVDGHHFAHQSSSGMRPARGSYRTLRSSLCSTWRL
jgi:hypothetical protein